MNVRNNVVLTFNSNLGEIVRISIPRADMTLTTARVQETMEDMIDDGIIVTSNGIPTSIHGAELVSTHRAPLLSA